MHAPMPSSSTTPPPSRGGTWSVGTLTYSLNGLIVLFGLLLLGDFAYSLRERSVVPISQVMLRQQHASDLITSLIYGSIPAILTMVMWPILSVWSDRTRTGWGRRIPFLLIPTPLVCLAMVGLAFSPMMGRWLHGVMGGTGSVETWIIGVFAICWIVFEVFALISSNLFTALVADVVPSQVIGRFFAMFRMVSLGAGIFFNFSLLKHAEDHFIPLFLGIAAVYFIGFTIMCLFVKEGQYPPPPPVSGPTLGRIGGTIRETIRSPFYVLLFLTLALVALGGMPGNIFMFNMAKSYALDLDQFGKAQALIYAISIVLSFPIGWLSDRFHPMRTAFACLAVFFSLNLVAALYVSDARSFQVMFVLISVAGGAYMTASASLMPRLFPRLQFSQFFAAANVVINLFAFLGTPLLGWIIDLSGHWYQLVYIASALLLGGSLACWLVLFRFFKRLGGFDHYQAP